MANQEHLDILAKGVEAWNAWRKEHSNAHPDLAGARLVFWDLIQANLVGANLREAALVGANLIGANLVAAHLNDANLANAGLHGADLEGADLTGANLVGSTLHGANLRKANLGGADVTGARVGQTYFIAIDLSAVKGLDAIQHQGPSFISIDTIYKSKGRIPEIFLRGVGVPENLITYMKSLTGAAFDFYSCFISYSTKDQEFADRLYADLQAKGVRCWFAPHDIQAGKKVHEQIDEAIKVYDKLLLILSDASMGSNWVKTEIANARAKEVQQKRQMLFPISIMPFDQIKKWKLFDADTGIDSAREIREYFVPDFSNWKDHDTYAKAFDLLVRSLKADSSRAASEAAL